MPHPCTTLFDCCFVQAEAHPDRHGSADASAQQAIADHASAITDAYAVLKAPHLRATHLLELLGAPLDEDTGGDVLGPGFLMHVMEVREELEEAFLAQRWDQLRHCSRDVSPRITC